jgi:hypothetical protein
MGKYSEELKLMVVREYLKGKLGYRALAKKHGIKSKSAIDRWVKVYEKFGEDGLTGKKHPEEAAPPNCIYRWWPNLEAAYACRTIRVTTLFQCVDTIKQSLLKLLEYLSS